MAVPVQNAAVDLPELLLELLQMIRKLLWRISSKITNPRNITLCRLVY